MPFVFSSSLSLLLAGLLVHVVLAADGEIEIASVSFGVTSSGCLCSPDALLSEAASTCNGHSECTMYATSSQCDVDCGAATKTLKIEFRCSSDGPVMDGLVWTVTCAEGQGCLVSCERGSLGITVMSASYGLYHADCPRTQGTGLQVGWCKTETVLSSVKGKCDGSYTCSVAASPDAVCQGVDPCPGDSDHLVNTLSINYRCSYSPVEAGGGTPDFRRSVTCVDSYSCQLDCPQDPTGPPGGPEDYQCHAQFLNPLAIMFAIDASMEAEAFSTTVKTIRSLITHGFNHMTCWLLKPNQRKEPKIGLATFHSEYDSSGDSYCPGAPQRPIAVVNHALSVEHSGVVAVLDALQQPLHATGARPIGHGLKAAVDEIFNLGVGSILASYIILFTTGKSSCDVKDSPSYYSNDYAKKVVEDMATTRVAQQEPVPIVVVVRIKTQCELVMPFAEALEIATTSVWDQDFYLIQAPGPSEVMSIRNAILDRVCMTVTRISPASFSVGSPPPITIELFGRALVPRTSEDSSVIVAAIVGGICEMTCIFSPWPEPSLVCYTEGCDFSAGTHLVYFYLDKLTAIQAEVGFDVLPSVAVTVEASAVTTGAIVTTSIAGFVAVIAGLLVVICVIVVVVYSRRMIRLTGRVTEEKKARQDQTGGGLVNLRKLPPQEEEEDVEEIVVWVGEDGEVIEPPTKQQLALGSVKVLSETVDCGEEEYD